VGQREPLTPKQKLLAVVTLVILNTPALAWWWYWGFYRDYFSQRAIPPYAAAVGAVNLLVGVILLALITEKWIRKTK
jgi:hypothetical protein